MKTSNTTKLDSSQSKHQPHYAVKKVSTSEQELYREQAQKLLIKGGIGFVIGFILVFATEGELSSALLMGILFAGIPRGWSLLGRFIGHWFAFGSGAFVFLVYFLQFVGACIIGWLVYPISLLNTLTKAQEPGSLLQKIFRVGLIFWIMFLALIFGVVIWGSFFAGK